MYSIYDKIRGQIEEIIKSAISQANSEGLLPEVDIPPIMTEKPREEAFGDLSTNIAMQMAKQAKKAPRNIAQVLIDRIKICGTFVDKVEIAGPGFINFHLSNKWLYETLALIDEKKDAYGQVNIGNGDKVMVEFVSANPTGPLHMGNARRGALGDLSLIHISEPARLRRM